MINAFEYANRNDVKGIDKLAGKLGKVVKTHPTNGVQVIVDSKNTRWFEPGALLLIKNDDDEEEEKFTSIQPRLLPTTYVKC
jgi:hypothetical protein